VWLVLGGTKRSGIVAFLRGARPHLWDNPLVLSRRPALGVADATVKRDRGTLEGHRDTSGERVEMI
jgi:hypothetical protein